MQIYKKAKCYDAQGLLTRSGTEVVIHDDRVMIGDSTYPIADVKINSADRTITSPDGWEVAY